MNLIRISIEDMPGQFVAVGLDCEKPPGAMHTAAECLAAAVLALLRDPDWIVGVLKMQNADELDALTKHAMTAPGAVH